MKQFFVFVGLALATAMAYAQTSVSAFATSAECQVAQQAQPALEYVPSVTVQHQSDDAVFALEEGECYFMNVPEKISFPGMAKGWAWVPVQSGTEMLKDKNGRIRYGKCRNLTNGSVPFLPPTTAVSSVSSTKQDDDSKLAAQIKADLTRIEANQQQQLGDCAMVLAAQRQQYAGDPHKKQISATGGGSCGFWCRFWETPAVIPVYGYGYGYNTYYGGGYRGGGGYNRGYNSGGNRGGGHH